LSKKPNLIEGAQAYFDLGNIPLAEAICQHMRKQGWQTIPALLLLSRIAIAIGLPAQAKRFLQDILKADPSCKEARQQLRTVDKERKRQNKKTGGRKSISDNGRYLLIKAWAHGFWSDMDHVLGQLLVAEITDRTPVIYWGRESLFRDPDCENAYEQFFEPVSQVSVDQLISGAHTWFPPKWSALNIKQAEINKWTGPGSRASALYTLARDEDIVVSDFHTYVNDIIPWIPDEHSYRNRATPDLYRDLWEKHIRVRANILEKIDAFWTQSLAGGPVLAVHVRGSDKIGECSYINEVNKQYSDVIAEFRNARPELKIFLLTDSELIKNKYVQQYGECLVYTNCTRTESDVGLHYQEQVNRRDIGFEVLQDVVLASRCDFFIGIGNSNVSTSIQHMKNWPADTLVLLGENRLYAPHLFLHNA